jgi:hypothetical protein
MDGLFKKDLFAGLDDDGAAWWLLVEPAAGEIIALAVDDRLLIDGEDGIG